MQKLIIVLLSLLTLSSVCHATIKQPRLVIQIVVDQLRGDLIQQHQQQFGANGFDYLLAHSINYQNTHHPHANTTTCAGHASIATGSYPSMHGIINNEWYDRKSNKMMYCVEDLETSILPTRHTKKIIPGCSPRNLYVSTLSDEIVLAQKGRAFGISFKDRSAITLAGHAGKAFWFDTSNGGFITSTFYTKNYPKWVDKWNDQYKPDDFDWHMKRPLSEYQHAKSPVFHHEDEIFGQTFPHHVTHHPKQDYFKALSRTPNADKLTADFAEQVLIEEKLGQNVNKTDYLGISFSAVDAIGHQFGPDSLEAEDNLLALDQTLAHLLNTIDQHVGLHNTLIILTADHGVNNTPSYLEAHHIKEVQPLNIPETGKYIHQLLKKQYQLPEETLVSITPPFIYLNHSIINQRQLKLSAVSKYLAQQLTLRPGVFRAYALPVNSIEKNWLSAKVDKMYYPERSGDIYLVEPPNQTNGSLSPNRVSHGSPWRYDSYVPLLFVHPEFHPQRISRQTFTPDIAATLAAILKINYPSAATGTPLVEVTESF